MTKTNTAVNNINKGEKSMSINNRLSRGNYKLPSSIGIFNLPRLATCPGATDWCKKWCYTAKAERQYKKVLPFRNTNLELSKSKAFVRLITDEIKRSRLKTIRIHESGDFYNQEYLDKWIEIANNLPSVTFFAYTKSYHLLDFSKVPSNFIVRASMDSTTPLTIREKYSKLFLVADIKEGEAAPGYFVCPGSCKTCTYCYTKGNGNVCFNKH